MPINADLPAGFVNYCHKLANHHPVVLRSMATRPMPAGLLPLGLILLCCAQLTVAAAPPFHIKSDAFMLGEDVFQIISGSMHYFRIHPDYWEDRLQRAAAIGVGRLCSQLERLPGFQVASPLPAGQHHRSLHPFQPALPVPWAVRLEWNGRP